MYVSFSKDEYHEYHLRGILKLVPKHSLHNSLELNLSSSQDKLHIEDK